VIVKHFIFNFACKNQKLLEGFAIFLVFLSVSFSFGQGEVVWTWKNYPFIALFMVLIAVLTAVLWVSIEKRAMQQKIFDIIEEKKSQNRYNLLTNRQKQVYDLILENKSNKEICQLLFIELSTLKTHINKIYKILEVRNRKELKIQSK